MKHQEIFALLVAHEVGEFVLPFNSPIVKKIFRVYRNYWFYFPKENKTRGEIISIGSLFGGSKNVSYQCKHY